MLILLTTKHIPFRPIIFFKLQKKNLGQGKIFFKSYDSHSSDRDESEEEDDACFYCQDYTMVGGGGNTIC